MLWLLLHYVGQRGALASDACVARLKKLVPQYRKGVLGAEMQLWLMKHVGEASERARGLEAEHVRKDAGTGGQVAVSNKRAELESCHVRE